MFKALIICLTAGLIWQFVLVVVLVRREQGTLRWPIVREAPATVRMTTALVEHLGLEAPDGRHAFSTPAAMAEADEDFYRDTVRAGYRGAYLRSLAAAVAEGSLDLEVLNDPELPDEEVAERLLALPGCGPYATAHMMMLLGRYSRLILDSWTRPKYARLNGRKAADRTIERRFRRYRDYAGLAFWLYLTRDWVAEGWGRGARRGCFPTKAKPANISAIPTSSPA
jgi:3-methyladenine DNA glycosylase/8-oxoguanine DNA glycosylase